MRCNSSLYVFTGSQRHSLVWMIVLPTSLTSQLLRLGSRDRSQTKCTWENVFNALEKNNLNPVLWNSKINQLFVKWSLSCAFFLFPLPVVRGSFAEKWENTAGVTDLQSDWQNWQNRQVYVHTESFYTISPIYFEPPECLVSMLAWSLACHDWLCNIGKQKTDYVNCFPCLILDDEVELFVTWVIVLILWACRTPAGWRVRVKTVLSFNFNTTQVHICL